MMCVLVELVKKLVEVERRLAEDEARAGGD